MISKTLGLLVFLYLTVNRIECRTRGGGGRGGGRFSSSRSRPSSAYHPPAYHPPAYHPPAYHPPAYHPPAYHPPAYHPPAHNPSPSHPSLSHGQGSGAERPIGFNVPKASDAVGSPKHVAPMGKAPSREGGARPIGFVDPHQPSAPVGPAPIGFVQPRPSYGNRPGETPKHSNPLGNGPPPYSPPIGHPPSPNPAGYGPPPAYPGNYHGGYPTYPSSGVHHPYPHPQTQGGGVTIINNNVNNHHYSSGGWSYSPPVYTSHDTGSTALGFFLGYSLAKVTTPSYHYHNSYYDGNGYTPRFDHYTVHHYYHNKEDVPKEATIQPNTIVGCVGDSGSFCPANTTSLCTNNGAVMCVASATSTVPCANEKQTNCVKSTVPCQNNTSPECQHATQGATSISIPCISTAKIYGNLSYQNNSIVVSNTTFSGNGTVGNSGINSTAISGGAGNVTVVDVSVNATVTNSSTPTNITSTEKAPVQMFCVTVLALPAERKPSEGEKLFAHTKDIFSQFTVKALGID